MNKQDSNNNIEIQDYCEAHQIRLTPLRKKILGLLIDAKQPMTAYSVLDALRKSKPKAQVMSVYRVLDYLCTSGLVHRIENLNAFIPCRHLFERHTSQWLICEKCGDTEECALPIFSKGIDAIEEQSGFTVNNSTIELIGLCKSCQKES